MRLTDETTVRSFTASKTWKRNETLSSRPNSLQHPSRAKLASCSILSVVNPSDTTTLEAGLNLRWCSEPPTEFMNVLTGSQVNYLPDCNKPNPLTAATTHCLSTCFDLLFAATHAHQQQELSKLLLDRQPFNKVTSLHPLVRVQGPTLHLKPFKQTSARQHR